MIKKKKGNVTTFLLPIVFMLLIEIIVALIFIYIQISICLYEVKLNTFYVIQSSMNKEDYENIVYRNYKLNEKELKRNINNLLEENYLYKKQKRKGIVDIECCEASVINNRLEIVKHTKDKYKVPIICVKLKIIFKPLISVLGNEIEIKMHDDIKLSLLEFN